MINVGLGSPLESMDADVAVAAAARAIQLKLSYSDDIGDLWDRDFEQCAFIISNL